MGKEWENFEINDLPTLSENLRALDYQLELACVCHYLLEQGYATRSGRYDEKSEVRPLFSDRNKRAEEGVDDDKLVDSMDRKSGAKLLSDPIVYLKGQSTLERTVLWIVKEFPIIAELAQKQYKMPLDINECSVHIIVAATFEISGVKRKQIRKKVFRTNSLPSLDKELSAFDFQRELAYVCHYLLDKQHATTSGEYNEYHRKKPLFYSNSKRNHDPEQHKLVNSMSEESGAKLLSDPIVYIDDQLTLEKTMLWVAKEFPIVVEKAQKQYRKVLDVDKHPIHTIVAAAHTLSETKNPKNMIELLTTPEKILLLSGGFAIVLGMKVGYKLYAEQILYFLAFLNSLSVLLYGFSFFILYNYSKERLYKIISEYKIILLASFLAMYMLVLIPLIPVQSKFEMPYVIFYSMFVTIFLQVMCFYFSFTRFLYSIAKYKNFKCILPVFRPLVRYRKNIASFMIMWFWFLFGSVTILLIGKVVPLWGIYISSF